MGLFSYWNVGWVLLAGALTVFYLWVQKRLRYFEDRGIPHLKPTFLLGTLSLWKSLLGFEQIGIIHLEIYKKLKGVKIGGIYQGLTPVLTVHDPELINRIMIKDFSHFHDRGVKIDEEVNPLEGHLFLLSGEKWRTLRYKLSPTFTSSKLKWMYSQMETCSRLLLEFMKLESEKGEVEVRDLLARFTTDVIGSCVFGYEPESLKDPNCNFRVMGSKIFRPSYYYILLGAFRFVAPELFFRFKLKTIPDDVSDFFTSIIRQTFDQRKKSGSKRNDFVQLLLQLKEKGWVDTDPRDYLEDDLDTLTPNIQSGEKIELTDDLLTAQAFVFFVAGFETSATSLSFTFYFLAKNQEIQEKARKEVKEVKKKFGGFTYEALKEMHYLEACFNEAARLYPPIPVLFRECNKTLILEDGTTIEKGMQTLIPVIGLHSDPELYPEPEKYRPERFLEGQGSTPGSFLPFGDGPRICIGKRFAQIEVKIALAETLDNFRLTPGKKLEEPLKMNPKSFVLQPERGIWLNIEKLTDTET